MATQESQKIKKKSGLVGYLKDTKQELKRVTWSSKKELLKNTGIVLATIISFTILVWGLDTVLSGALGLILK